MERTVRRAPITRRLTTRSAACLFAAASSLSGCASFTWGEQPTDLKVARMHWYRDAPGFRMQDLEWKHVAGPDAVQRLANLCGKDSRFAGRSCAYRVPQGGLCLVYSLFTQEQARLVRDASGESIETHELRHCGVNLPTHGGWTHREAVVLR